MWAPHVMFVFIVVIAASFKSAFSGSDIKYVGCYDPGYSINRNYHNHLSPFSQDRCVTMCRVKKTRYMGAEASDDFCYCGDDIPHGSEARTDILCNSPCPGADISSNDTCGGDWLISVYDLEPVPSPGAVGGADARNVSFLVGTSVGVRMYSTVTAGFFATITNSTSWAYSVDYHLQRNLVFIYSNGELFKSTLDPKSEPGSASPTHVTQLSSCEGFAVNWVHNTIYWMDCSTNSLKLTDLEGKGTTTLMKTRGDRKTVKRMELDPIAEKVFWTSDGTLEWCDLNGENFRTNLSQPGVYVRAIALDISSRRLFYVGSANESTNLYELAYSTAATLGTTKHPRMQELRSVYGLGVVGDYIYWVNYANVRDVIYRLPLNMSGQPEMIRPIDRAVWHMKVVDPELQRPVRDDPCTKLACRHACVHQGGVPRCLCPDGQRLDKDNTTCSSTDQSYGYVGCYSSDYPSSYQYTRRLANLTLESCLSHCRDMHDRYAGIDISEGHCHCGEDLTAVSASRDDYQCAIPCPGRYDVTCGGDWLMSVFELYNSTVSDVEHGLKFLIGISSGVMMHDPSKPKAETSALMSLSSWGYNVDYHYKRNLAFVTTKGLLYKSQLLPNGKAPSNAEVVKVVTSCDGFAVDWETDTIYVADCDNNSILSMTLAGDNETVVINRPVERAMVKRMEVDPYTRMLFWTADGVLESCDLSGNNFRTNLTDSDSSTRAIALHLATRTLYYITVGTEGGEDGLFSLQYDQPEPVRRKLVALPLMKSVYGLGVFMDHIYWMNYANIRDVIYKAPLNVSHSDDVEVIKVVEKAAWHMKLVHRDLQRRPPPPPLTTSHEHAAIQAISEKTNVLPLLLAVLTVVLVVVLAGFLVYLVDTHWTRLHSRLFPRAGGERQTDSEESPAYNTTDDRVLLI